MTTIPRQITIATSHGHISVEECGQGDVPILLIHGNSSCREVFRNQLDGELAERHRFVAFDLPGHGLSGDAIEPSRTYTLSGYSDAARELLGLLGIQDVVIFGWSLGGHIAMEMAPKLSHLRGLMICGAPPVRRSDLAAGFVLSPHMRLAGKEELSPSEIEQFSEAVFGAKLAPQFHQAIERTDGLARSTLFDPANAGEGVDQRWVVENLPMPLAVVHGGDDPFVKLDYVDSLAYANLWEGRCQRLPGLGHAPLVEAPEVFNPILDRFLLNVARAAEAKA
jgi:pimeloyl-ACP methyl ester carboxylesterase